MIWQSSVYKIEKSFKANLSQQGCKSGVICSGTEQSHSKDRVVRDLCVGVVRELTQRVKDIQLWVRNRNQAEGERNSSSDCWLAISKQVSEMAEEHF